MYQFIKLQVISSITEEYDKSCAVNYLDYSLCQIRSLPMPLLIHD